MEILILLLFAALIGVAALLASIAIWAPRATFVRSAAVVATALFVPLTYLGINELLSKPKPMAQEWADKHVAEATVLGVSLDEGKAIYLWLRLDGARAPRYYVLPWQPKVAEKLQNVVDEAIEKEATVRIMNPFTGRSFLDLGELNIEIVPPPRPPQKRPPDVPQIFNPRELSI